MTVRELNKRQLTELKQNYYTQLLDERGETPSMQELADIDEYVSDAEIYAEYGDTDFMPEDFAVGDSDSLADVLEARYGDVYAIAAAYDEFMSMYPTNKAKNEIKEHVNRALKELGHAWRMAQNMNY